MLVLKQVFSFIRLVHTETSPRQLCMGFVFGMLLGFVPPLNLIWITAFTLLFVVRVNIGAAFFGMALFKLLSFVLDPLFDSLGRWLLIDCAALLPFWRLMYNAPVLPYTRFNNSIVMGSFVTALVLAVPMYFFSKKLILTYRQTVVTRVKQSSVARLVMASKLYKMYERYREYSW